MFVTVEKQSDIWRTLLVKCEEAELELPAQNFLICRSWLLLNSRFAERTPWYCMNSSVRSEFHARVVSRITTLFF